MNDLGGTILVQLDPVLDATPGPVDDLRPTFGCAEFDIGGQLPRILDLTWTLFLPCLT